MQTDYSERTTHHQVDSREFLVEAEPPISVSHFARVLRSYSGVILLSLIGVVLAYLIVAVFLYLRSPSEQITSQTFRLDFEGAGQGEYPNKTKFNIADIISGPIVTRVWQENHLGNYVPFGDFSRAVFVLETNRQFELLAAEYQTRLADPKLTPIDRDRLQKEFELKAESITKNEYSINLDRRAGGRTIPEPLARKVLLDVLNDWADFAVNQQHVIAYQVSVLSPAILNVSAVEQADPVAGIEVLRSKATRIMRNIELIETLPGSSLARTPEDHLSLEEVRLRLDEIMRFRLEPLLSIVLQSSDLITDRATTMRFLESQLAYDQRQLDWAQRYADSIRDSIAVYEQPAAKETPASQPANKTAEPNKGGEAVMPQLSDTFLDRLVDMTGRAADAHYRQSVVDIYRKASSETIPLKEAVAYDLQVLNEFQKPAGGSKTLNSTQVRAQIDQTRAEVGQLIGKMNELFQIVSRNMTPSTQLFTITGPATTRTFRSVSAARLASWGVLAVLVALPIAIIFSLLHNRIREEEAAEDLIRQERKLATSETLP